MKKFTSKNQKTGEIGEKVAEMFLVKHGFTVLERNFTCKTGEIDIICKKFNRIHFVEVKSGIRRNVSRETRYNPFSNISKDKIVKCVRAIGFWFSINKYVSRETLWQMDGISVSLDSLEKSAHVEYLENINII